MKKYVFLIVLFLIRITTLAQDLTIKTIDKSDQDYYNQITFMSQGEIFWTDEKGISFRLVIITSEIYNTIYIEKIILGEEGGRPTLEWKRQINTNSLYNYLQLNGEFQNVQFVSWISWDSFKLTIQNQEVIFENIANEYLIIKKLNQ